MTSGQGGAAQANYGGGGGGSGAAYAMQQTGGNGGSGIVFLKILAADYSGITTGSPTVSDSGDYKILQYNSSGSYTA